MTMMISSFDNSSSSNKKRSFEDINCSNISSGELLLPHEFVPGPNDVICGRGKAVHKHRGNINFRQLIENHIEKYSKATTKLGKSVIVSSIIDQVSADSKTSGSGFVKLGEDGRWYEAGDHLSREKIGQCLRDLLHKQYKSSSKAKQRRRRVEQIKFDDQVDELLVENNCKKISKKIKAAITVKSRTDEEIQFMFNQANCHLLQVFKENEERARKRRKLSCQAADSSSCSNNNNNNNIVPLSAPSSSAAVASSRAGTVQESSSSLASLSSSTQGNSNYSTNASCTTASIADTTDDDNDEQIPLEQALEKIYFGGLNFTNSRNSLSLPPVNGLLPTQGFLFR